MATSVSATEGMGIELFGSGLVRFAWTVMRTLVTQSRWLAVSAGGTPVGTSSLGGLLPSKYRKLSPPAGTPATIVTGRAVPSVGRQAVPGSLQSAASSAATCG